MGSERCGGGPRRSSALRWIEALPTAGVATQLLPCLVFLVSDGKRVFGGNNEDYIDPNTRMWAVPAENGKHGRICFGFGNGFAQGGVNDAGLFFDGLALDHQAVSKTDKPAFPGNPGELALAECSSVAQVVELFERYDRGFLASAQLLFGDRGGDAVIFEGNAVIRKEGSYLLATNFRQSETYPRAATCQRFQDASRLLDAMDEVSVDECRKVLAAAHQEGTAATLYSNVYDLEKGLLYLYHFHDYENVVVIDVAIELAKGAHTVELSSLFPQTFAFTNSCREAEAKVAAQRERERDKSVDPRTFDRLVGRFRVRDGIVAGLEFSVARDKDRLFVDFAGQERTEMIPRGGSRFVMISLATRAELEFVGGEDGEFREAKLRQGGLEVCAFKLE